MRTSKLFVVVAFCMFIQMYYVHYKWSDAFENNLKGCYKNENLYNVRLNFGYC